MKRTFAALFLAFWCITSIGGCFPFHGPGKGGPKPGRVLPHPGRVLPHPGR